MLSFARLASSRLLANAIQDSQGHIRCMGARARKRFYREVSLARNGGDRFELLLDGRKLKTPLGNPLSVEGEALAMAVQQEWAAQKELILTQQMHLTGLCNACVDNPTGADAGQLADAALAYLDTDTVLFFSTDNDDLAERQQQLWLPLVDWFCQRHGVHIQPTNSIHPPTFSHEAKETLRKSLLSHSLPCLHAFSFGVDAIKSFVLMSALIERRLTVEEAVSLARLEVQFQTERWGSVEWSHDLELHDTTARLSAAALFILLSNSQHVSKTKV